MSEPTTACIFRIYPDGQTIALFPYEPWNHRGDVTSYMHIGQHGAADYAGVIQDTKPATPEQYAPLQRELESIGYNLQILKRRPRT